MGYILDTYATWDDAFEFFNGKLFGGALPPVAFGIAKQKHSHGHYAPGRYSDGDGNELAEIQMNADSLARGDRDSMATLVHEMVHHWQYTDPDAKPGRGRYHNAEWARKMLAIGLAPHSATTGEKGTGDRVTHKIVEGAPFAQAFNSWKARGFTIRWYGKAPSQAEAVVAKAKRKSKTKYTCPACHANVWGKPGMILYDECGEEFIENEN